jgi:hypothetical protein
MLRTLVYCIPLLFLAAAVRGEAVPEGDKLLPGISIVGNDDAPKSLVIVPWKSSELGNALDVSRVLGDGRQPVDRDVFMRELDYYQIRAAAAGAESSSAQ